MPLSPLDSPSQSELVLSLLYQGKRVELTFPSSSLRETFRKRLYSRKATQDEAMKLLLEEERKVLRCQTRDSGGKFTALFFLEEAKPVVFPFSIIDANSVEGAEENSLERGEEKENEQSIRTAMEDSPRKGSS